MKKILSSSSRRDHRLFVRVLLLAVAFFIAVVVLLFINAIREKNRQSNFVSSANDANQAVPAKPDTTGDSLTNLLAPSSIFANTNSIPH